MLALTLTVAFGAFTQNAATTTGVLPPASPQGPDLDYSNFKHTSARHAALGCNSCHQRSDNSIRPTFPGHPACINCHLSQFTTAAIPMCAICHSNTSSAKPPLKAFPANFKEAFNIKFDHAQHLKGTARPKSGCVACHDRSLNRGVALRIPRGLSAHTDCYECHTPGSKSSAGREIASCLVCHEAKREARPSTSARAFREEFSHAEHGPRQKLDCTSCHTATAGLPPSRQVSSPATAQHFPGAGPSCGACHNGKKSFGGDLAFKDCKRCHSGTTF